MTIRKGSAHDLEERLRRKAPAYLDLITATTDKEFEDAFDALLEQAVSYLEQNKKDFQELDENGLSAALAGKLMIPGLDVSRETNSNGHVDITIEATHSVPQRRKLGEAKIYNGPVYHFGGLEQLLGRYTTGREGRGLLIVYFRKKDIKGLLKKLRDRMDNDLPCRQKGICIDHCLTWSFLTTHSHSSGEDVQVGHIGCNLYMD